MTQNFNQEVDQLVNQAVFGDSEQKQEARFRIWQLAIENDVIPASINDFYLARGAEELPQDFTVPAINVRGMAYDLGWSLFEAARERKVGALICELARSEMSYTDQPPHEYATVIMAAALRAGWSGPLFLQCDHFQAKAKSPGQPKEGEIEAIKDLVSQAISAGMYNVDIDMSTLVDLDRATEAEQQAPNIKYSTLLTEFIRELEPTGVTISLGGEIGHIGGKNSTVEDFEAFMDGYNQLLPKGMTGLSKISIQTGTSHGGVVKADGTLAEVAVDFDLLATISKVARDRYKIGGAVQHGASTLPDEFFHKFAQAEALEVHLATGFQNLQFDHPAFPTAIKEKMYKWLDENQKSERKPDQTDEQFHYKLRKKAWGQFKKEVWSIDENRRAQIHDTLKERFGFLFEQLNVTGTKDMVEGVVKPVIVDKTLDDFAVVGSREEDVSGLAD